MTDPAEGIGGDAAADEPGDSGGRATVWLIFLSCLAVEAVLFGAELGLWGAQGWRRVAIEHAGFWPGLLGDWQPNYPAQPWLMFASYGFLHAGPVHFVVNMLTLWSLAPATADQFGQARFLALYLLSVIGGAVAFAALSFTPSPMVGASGALFGVAGALVAADFLHRRRNGASLTPVYRAVLLLVVLNLVLWWAMHGLLAWQTHLGGFVTGWLFALWGRRRNAMQ
jgi:membrane associated rhomboid family serine protease